MSQRVLTFGATGATGTHFVKHALAAGLTVRVFVRSPEKLAAQVREHPQLEVVKGDLTDLAAIDEAVRGSDLVVSMAGNAKASKELLMTAFVKQLAQSMRTHGVKRFVYQAGAFSPMPGEKQPLVLRVMRSTIGAMAGLSAMLADNDAVMAYLASEAPDLDWTVTRPGMIKEAPSKGTLKCSDKPTSSAVTFVDLAAFDLAVARSHESVRQAPYATY